MANQKIWDGNQWIQTSVGKQEFDNLIGNVPLETTAQTVIPAINEINTGLSEANTHLAKSATDDVHGLLSGGKIIQEVGSNVNGRYVRFADGTQICYSVDINRVSNISLGNVFQSGRFEVVLPASFIDTNYTFSFGSNNNDENIAWVVGGRKSTFKIDLLRVFGFTSAANCTPNLIAIGRWK